MGFLTGTCYQLSDTFKIPSGCQQIYPERHRKDRGTNGSLIPPPFFLSFPPLLLPDLPPLGKKKNSFLKCVKKKHFFFEDGFYVVHDGLEISI